MSSQGKRGYSSTAVHSGSNLYRTFSDQDESRSGYTPTNQETSGEQDPLLTPSDSTHRSPSTEAAPGTVLHLLITPRLPLALLATVVMAMLFAALESVRVGFAYRD